jgi:hypothetical protein
VRNSGASFCQTQPPPFEPWTRTKGCIVSPFLAFQATSQIDILEQSRHKSVHNGAPIHLQHNGFELSGPAKTASSGIAKLAGSAPATGWAAKAEALG